MPTSDVLRSCINYLFDCDGVLWKSSNLIPSASALIEYLLNSKRSVYLITNNSRKSAQQYAEKCRNLGLPVTERNIICTANVAAKYLKAKDAIKSVYVIGERGIALELEKAGITYHGIGPDEPKDISNPMDDVEFHNDKSVDAVLVGFDSHFNYRKLMRAATYIYNGAVFYATNEDAQLPEGGKLIPGTGSIVSAVRVASGKDPVVLGKPHKPTFDILSKLCDLDSSKTVMIGDNLDTDIVFGNKFGFHTACVLSGVTTAAQIEQVNSTPGDHLRRPSFVFESVLDILEILKS